MITQEQAEEALEKIITNSSKIAKSKAEKEYLEEYRKSKKASLVQQAKGTVLEKESYAYAHPDYIGVLEGLRVAHEEYERRRWMMVGWQTTIDVWRTQESTRRAHG